jgi:hypothetical protein
MGGLWRYLPSLSVIPRQNLGVILGMGKIHSILEVVDVQPKSSMHCFHICVGFSTVIHVGRAMCVVYVILAHADVCALIVLNTCVNSEPLLYSFVLIFPN